MFSCYLASEPSKTRPHQPTQADREIWSSLRSLPAAKASAQGVQLSRWGNGFPVALLRLLQLGNSLADTAVMGEARLRELYYINLKGDAGLFARQAFAPGNGIARSIADVASHLDNGITIEEMAAYAGMSRAVFHRKFKQVTTMLLVRFVKIMILNNAAMKISGGMTVSKAAMDVGYVSASQFSRDFKRTYGRSPRQWGYRRQSAACA